MRFTFIIGNCAICVLYLHYLVSLPIFVCRSRKLVIQTTPTGTEIFDVEARDNDRSAANSRVTFELTDTSLPFSIDENSGEITINGSLEAITYQIEVLVKDGGTPSLNSTGTFTLEVAPANDHTPVFEEPFEFNITENSTPSTPVFTFTVTDEDNGAEGTVNLTLQDSDYAKNFTLSFTSEEGVTQGQLYLLDPFDRESITDFNLTIEATDTGYEIFRRSSSQTFEVNVLDINDNSPIFTNVPYSVTVAEDRTNGYVFFQVTASDADIGINKELEFSLDDYFNGTFAINGSSGEISVTGTLHRVTQEEYVLVVSVKDGGTPSLNSTTTLNITVDEVNDNSPYFTSPTQPVTLTLPEDTDTGYVLLNISAGDDDSGLAGEVEFSLNPSDSLFRIENDTLVLDSSLDYEVHCI